MKFNRGSNAEANAKLFPERFIEKFILKSFADEGEGSDRNTDEGNTNNNEGNVSTVTTTVNYEDLISRARQQERQKQYKKIEKLEGSISTLTEQHNNDLLKIAEIENKLEKAENKLTESGKDDSEEVATLKKEVESLKSEKEKVEKDFEQYKSSIEIIDREEIEKEIREAVESEYNVKLHKTKVLAEHKEDLFVPELVVGDTIEEIDASLQKALERSAEIAQRFGGNANNSGSPKPKTGTPSRLSEKELSVNEIASLDPSSPEYAEFRKKMGLK